MGADIHIRIERRTDGKWENIPWTTPWNRQWPTDASVGDISEALEMPDVFDARNYDLFGVLAGVRNGTWGDPVTPIASPRGLPEDMAMPVSDADAEWLGEHSFSWATLRELQAYPWDIQIQKQAYTINENDTYDFKETGKPPTAYASYSSSGRHITWEEPIATSVRGWSKSILPILSMLGDPDNVRLVFGFDS